MKIPCLGALERPRCTPGILNHKPAAHDGSEPCLAQFWAMAASFVVTHHHPSNSTCVTSPRSKSGVRRIGGRDNHWSIKSVGRTRPHNILLMEPVSNPSCLVWQLGRGRPPGLSLVNQNNPYLTEREVRATEARTSQDVRCTVHETMRAAYPQNRHGTRRGGGVAARPAQATLHVSALWSVLGSVFHVGRRAACALVLHCSQPLGHTACQAC